MRLPLPAARLPTAPPSPKSRKPVFSAPSAFSFSFLSISLERFLVEGDEDGLGAVVEANLIGNGVITAFFEFEIVDATNPNLLTATMASFATGPGVVQIRWNRFVFGALPSSAAFIDNITFHPVPEPGTLGLLAVSLVALAIARRRIS